jgi:quercetin dioxygenase-like cupin family protein
MSSAICERQGKAPALAITRKARLRCGLPAGTPSAKLPEMGSRDMRAGLIGVLVFFTAGGTALAQPASHMAIPSSPSNQQYDIPPGSKDQTVIITTRDFKPGQSATPHIHHGVEMAEVISGTIEVYRAGQKPEVVHAGGSFLIPRQTPHDAKNIGNSVAHLAITLVIDKGSVPRTPVNAALVRYK